MQFAPKVWAARSVICIAALQGMTGCSVATRPVVGPITLTDAKGASLPAIVSVQHGGAAIYFASTVTNDFETLGVDWAVTCSNSVPAGSLPVGSVDTSCGTFNPNHTTSGPVPTYPLPAGIHIVTSYTPPANIPKAVTVTITAHATSDPAEVSILTLNIT